MIEADAFLTPAKARGVDFFTGVPCSFLTPFINRTISSTDFAYVPAASEGEAVAIAAGAWLAGHETCVMMQNSGLGNAVNPLTSLNYPFRIPTLLIVTWRGGPGLKDEPQHELMGKITPELLTTIGVRHASFPKVPDAVEAALEEARGYMAETGLPYAFIMEKGDVADAALDGGLKPPPSPGERFVYDGGELPTRMQTLERLLAQLPDTAAVIATTGKAGRELFTLSDRDQHLYQVGSMGCASAMGLGVALHTQKPVLVVDGDGAVLMKMGALATIGAEAPKKLVHLVLDNGTYDSTGGQPTVSQGVDFAAVALASGYRKAYVCADLHGFETAVKATLNTEGPHLVHMRIQPGSMKDLGRPTISPRDVARRFQAFLTTD